MSFFDRFPFWLRYLLDASRASTWLAVWSNNRLETLFTLLTWGDALVTVPWISDWRWEAMTDHPGSHIFLVATLSYMGFVTVKQILRMLEGWLLSNISPAKSVAFSFVALSLLGGFVLWLPRCTGGTLTPNISFLDALFTSTSAICVTGLIVVDTATVYTRFGQILIMILIQIGGLGIMSAVGIFVFALGGQGGFRGRAVLSDLMGTEGLMHVKTLLRTIFLATLGLELVGSLVLYAGFAMQEASRANAGFHAVFHAVSAFNNAGFSTFSNSLESFATAALVILPVMGLVVAGGIGFQVIQETILWGMNLSKNAKHLSVHSSLVLRVTGILLLVGFLITWWGTPWGDSGWWQRCDASLFQSVTTRTAGFNTIPLAHVQTWALFGFMILMFIGAAPGGTAGGIKVSTAALLYYATKNTMKGREHIEINKRHIPMATIRSAFIISGLSVSYVSLALLALCWAEPDLPFFDLAFEVISAFGTVGLSLGVTAKLSALGKLIIICTMLVGRIGPLTMFIAMAHRRDDALYSYPIENVKVG